MKLLIKAIAKILGFRLDSEFINTEVMLSIIETYVDGLPIPNSSNLLIREVEEYHWVDLYIFLHSLIQ